jgi:succinate dehydrogenase / fumarate reductase cytochrome b subunit
MSWFTQTFKYSVGKKLLMGSTGLFFVIFLLEHVAGNFLLFNDDKGAAYNEYSHTLTHNHIIAPIITIIEILLFSSFIIHAIDGTILWLQNRKARPIGYVKNGKSQNSRWVSRNMMLGGSIIFIFLVIHLKTFFVPYRFTNSIPNLYDHVAEVFKNEWYSGFYVFAMVMLSLHLNHGFASAFQSLGLRNAKYYPFIKSLGLFLSIVICAGFAAQPLYFLLLHK